MGSFPFTTHPHLWRNWAHYMGKFNKMRDWILFATFYETLLTDFEPTN